MVLIFELEKTLTAEGVGGLITIFVVTPAVLLMLRKNRRKYVNERRKHFVKQSL